MPGQPRWPALQPYAESWVEGTARGRLWDTGSGYPAARFDEGDARIPGVVVVLRSGRLGEVVRLLDAIEGEGVLFRRVTVVTSEGPALAYEWVRSTDGLEPLPGGWIDQTLGRDRGPGSEPGVRILVEGRPGVGKTTLARRVVDLLRERDVPVAGFTTEEVRERGRRVGFALETAAGDRDFLAHLEFPGPPRVGRYGVELATMERLALPALESVPPGGVVVVDELGKMELASEAFTEAMIHLFHQAGAPVLATVHVHHHPVTDRLKARKGVELVRLTQANRDDLPAALVDRLAAAAG